MQLESAIEFDAALPRGELSKLRYSRRLVCKMSIGLCFEIAYMLRFSANAYLGLPLFLRINPAGTFFARPRS
jgi:hypothetical protein